MGKNEMRLGEKGAEGGDGAVVGVRRPARVPPVSPRLLRASRVEGAQAGAEEIVEDGAGEVGLEEWDEGIMAHLRTTLLFALALLLTLSHRIL